MDRGWISCRLFCDRPGGCRLESIAHSNGHDVEENTRLRPHCHHHHRMRTGRCGGEPETLDQCGQDDARLHHGEVRADADARACAEWQILIFVQLGAPFAPETAW